MTQSSLPAAFPSRLRWVLALLSLLAAIFAVIAYQAGRLAARPPLEVLGQVSPFTLEERSGAPVELEELLGHVWIADFIFTRCAGPCPLMSSRMARLQDELAALPEVRLVSFSVDPVADTPQALAAYAEKYHADPKRWLFLTGNVSTLYDLMERSFMLPVGPRPPADLVQPGDLITHTTRFVLIDRKGRIRGYFDSEEASTHDRLLDAVQRLHDEP